MNRAASPNSLARLLPLLLILGALAAAYAAGLHHYLSLDELRERRAGLEAFVSDHLIAAIALYMLIYASAVAISLPGALILTLSGGFLFGPWIGAAATVFAATIGATGIFLAARTALGDMLRARAGPWLERLERGFAENAFNYLFALRLFPGAPFFIVNLVPAFLGVRVRDFFFATLFGIIPGTLVYASVGSALRAAFDAGTDLDPADAARNLIFSPQILLPIAGLIALSLLPIIVKMVRKNAGQSA